MAKSLAKNSIYNVIYKGFTALFPLITTAYISRALLADGVGKVSYASTIVSYFAIIASLGLPQYGIKVIAQNYSREDRSKSFSELFTINFCSTLICIIAYYSIVNCWDYFFEKRLLLNVMGIQLILNIFNIDWFYQGTEEYRYITTRSIIIKILSFLAMLLFVRNSQDYVRYGLILCMATAGNYILNVWNLRNRIRLHFNNLNIKQHLSPVLILLVSSLATEIYTMLDTVMIDHFHGDTFVGYYSNSVKVIRLVHTLAIALVTPFYPRISLYLKEKRTKDYNMILTIGLKIILVMSIPCVFGIEVLSDRIVPVLFGTSFSGSILCIRILAPLIAIFSIAYFLGHIVLLATGNEKKILTATIVGAIINFFINYLLIPKYQHYGASVASVTAELIITVILIWHSHKYFNLEINKRYIVTVIFSGTVMGLLVYLSRFIPIGSTIGLLISILLGCIMYIVVLFAFKNDLIIMVWNNINSRFRK